MTVILGVHGVGNHQAKLSADQASTRLGERWTTALRAGLGPDGPSFDLRVAYYAPFLHTVTAQNGGDDPDRILPPHTRAMIRAWADQVAPMSAGVAQGRLTVPLRAAVDRIARKNGRSTDLLRRFVITFFREVDAYLTDDGDRAGEIRLRTRAHVAERIIELRPRVVVAHSLGSVVAYEALWTAPQVEIDLFLTLGSPLAMPTVVYPRLRPDPGGFGARPPGVRQWINVADVGDLVAVPRGFARHFDVHRDLVDSIGRVDFHTSGNYLSARATSTVLTALLGP
ncbi:serine peptidase [Embleya sp. NPDC055664]